MRKGLTIFAALALAFPGTASPAQAVSFAAPPPESRSYVYHSNGNGTFTDRAQKMGVDAPCGSVRQASFIDLDGDGKLDLFMADRNGPNRMFHNDGGKFTDIAPKVGLDDKR